MAFCQQLPEKSLYFCDEIYNIKRITANITDHQGSYRIITGQYGFLNITTRMFSVTLQVNKSALWRPFIFSLSLENSGGVSSFSDQVPVRGAVNSNDLCLCGSHLQ